MVCSGSRWPTCVGLSNMIRIPVCSVKSDVGWFIVPSSFRRNGTGLSGVGRANGSMSFDKDAALYRVDLYREVPR